MRKEKILIVDDLEMNRSILIDMLGENYDIIEAENGVQAVEILQKMNSVLDLVLLDIIMPDMDGFGVLNVMNENHWIDNIPVIIVSSERDAFQVERAYGLGITDFITRPFDTYIVRHRVINTLLLYTKQKRLTNMVEKQFTQKEKYSNTMIDILSHIVELRNGESGLHVLHVRAMTDFLLRQIRQISDKYSITDDYITLVSNAAALHDIGKIAIDEKILNKPGCLTDKEFEIMKTHTLIGAKMLEGESLNPNNPLVQTAYEVCRWHHERYDGKGYPDGLIGDDIPLSAQVVALADVYDALTSPRVYKASYNHDTAIEMILNGDCGAFSPLLMDCLRNHSDVLKIKMEGDVAHEINRREIKRFTDAVLNGKSSGLSDRTLKLLDYERMKANSMQPQSDMI
ncbi:MAG: response regulator [Oscillospiraceae bacterium]|nr:response regulator [Oscillospiraceae bacterium]